MAHVLLDPKANFVSSILRSEFSVTMLVMRACNRKMVNSSTERMSHATLVGDSGRS